MMDVFSSVCAALAAADSARLRAAAGITRDGADLAPWMVTVVRRIAIDWRRREEGRRRRVIPDGLSELHERIYTLRCLEGHSLVEAFEVLSSRGQIAMTFTTFLREVRELENRARCPDSRDVRRNEQISELVPDVVTDPVITAETVRRMETALDELPDDLRLAITLFVVDQLPAAQVAFAVGWPGAKTVYNRVTRALAALRARLTRDGVTAADLG
jgi:RNA polymerase sigma factor (sigma-70 family)